MNIGLSFLFNNIGMSFELTLLLVLTVGGLIFFAVDWKLGLVFEFLLSAGLFAYFIGFGYNYAFALIAMLCWLVIMSLTLYAVGKASKTPQVI